MPVRRKEGGRVAGVKCEMQAMATRTLKLPAKSTHAQLGGRCPYSASSHRKPLQDVVCTIRPHKLRIKREIKRRSIRRCQCWNVLLSTKTHLPL
ncbi:hypothetical protein MRB53_034710 [Persea americana]|uniref:Uncharacterized protein n=1 Tax=Persea americana TaxID=3435 RepID=A0ACC2K2J8_PERAE|nr:hypothetical protein MRB53_034710 [Persea americana]